MCMHRKHMHVCVCVRVSVCLSVDSPSVQYIFYTLIYNIHIHV